ncbi:pupal cuticle protein 27-like [Pieris rapae]|uniref:pupal cuticle protein 27-like n=1 Tax=Pieris rapae TaxID=64459 RepID=UPI001E2807CB|nr:pupal cuticle protein 27-like [Pieris rapae]
MFSLILLSVVSIAFSAQLPPFPPSKGASYLPPGQGSGVFGSGSLGSEGNNRPQAAAERSAAILKLDQDVGEQGFRYAFETSNGIQAEEAGDASQSHGSFSYKGDDGITYSVSFTAGEGGYQPQGAHLPVPPPTPQEILLALEQNARDEAAGIFDDGQYRAESSGSSGKQGGFGSANRQGNFKPNSGYSY